MFFHCIDQISLRTTHFCRLTSNSFIRLALTVARCKPDRKHLGTHEDETARNKDAINNQLKQNISAICRNLPQPYDGKIVDKPAFPL